MLQATVHRSIFEIAQDEWDEIVSPGHVWQTHAALALLEKDGIENCRPRYLVFRTDEGRIAAHIVAYIAETDLLIFSQGFIKALASLARRINPNFLRPLFLECGCPVSPGNPLSRRLGIRSVDLVGPLCSALERLAAREGILFILLRDFVDEEVPEMSAILSYGFSRIPNLPTTELQIRWHSYDDYVAAMRSRHRQKVRRGLKLAEKSGLTCRFRNDFATLAEQLTRQWNNVYEQAKEYRRERLTPEFYRGVNAALGCRAQLLEILNSERIVGHALVALDGNTLRWLFFGREEIDVRDGAYFLAIARIIRLAIEQGNEVVELGLTTYSPKTDFGARMVPLWMFVRMRIRLPKILVAKLFRFFNSVPQVQQRAAFKRE